MRLIANDGSELRRFDLNESPNKTGMEAVWFHGRDRAALIVNGGDLFSGAGKSLGRLPGLPEAVPPVDKEEILVYNPWATVVYIYSNGAVNESAIRGYRPGPRQYNARVMD